MELGGLSLSRELEGALITGSEPGYPLESTMNENKQTPSTELKSTIIDLVPKSGTSKTNNRLPASDAKLLKLQKRMLKQLRTSKLYAEAASAQQLPETMGVTMCPRILETYLTSLLNDERARQTIREHKLTASEAVAIRYYGLEGFQFVQPSLREKADPALGADFAPAGTFDNLIKECEGAFAKLPLLQPKTKLFRGTDFLFRDELAVGETYLDPAFVSSSTSSDVATQRFNGRFLLIFEVPEKDPRFRDVSPLTGNSKEEEVLGLPNIRFEVVARGEGAGTREDPEIVRLSPIAII
ncbi:hypothetical protein GCM10023165_18880 [Variovorax defluvii]|uniref:NAD(+)--protein-arginine ADP-ribosyltransferase n=1 Tax=Variovorax defluvii TaxID=913761 RepID=A0ABP8HHQ2_9BURK